MPVSRLGIIDLGTNSVRFDIHEIGPKRTLRMLHRERLMLRLGEGVFLKGRLDRAAVGRTAEAFASFRYTADQLGVRKIVAVATSAVRQASDREKLLRAIKKSSGIQLRVISGEEEARLIARGVLRYEGKLPKKFALVDIGGGSTEISLCKDRRALWSSSFKLGSARIEQLFAVGGVGISKKACQKRIDGLRTYVRELLDRHAENNHWGPLRTLIGSSGTVKALVRLQHEGDPARRVLNRRFLKRIIKKMCGLTRVEMVRIPGMDPKRIDMILGGAVLLDEIMGAFGASQVRYSDNALREGVLDEEIKLLHDKRDSHLGLHLEDLEERLRRSLTNPLYVQRVSAVCEDLFIHLAPLHHLKPKWRSLLRASILLQNTGRTISVLHHAQHSFYIAEHLDFPWIEEEERRSMAHLCLWHGEGKVSRRGLHFLKSAAERVAFLKALALLRLANALVWHERSNVRVARASITRRLVRLYVRANGSCELVKLRAEGRKKLFEQTFNRVLSIEARS